MKSTIIAAQVDTDRPIIILYVPTSTQRDEFKASIVFSEPVIGFEQSDVSLDGTAAASITAWAAKADNSVYTATITPTSSGMVTLGVDAGVATDAANNPNTAATAQTVNVDVDRPTVTIGVSPASSVRQPGAFIVTITFLRQYPALRNPMSLSPGVRRAPGFRAQAVTTPSIE